MLLRLLAIYLLLWFCGSKVVLEDDLFATHFRFGTIYTTDAIVDLEFVKGLPSLISNCLPMLGSQDIDFQVNLFLDAYGHRLADYHQIYEKLSFATDTNLITQISSRLGLCTDSTEFSLENKEMLFQLSLSICSMNYATVKNYAFILEYTGYYTVAKSLYQDCYLVTKDPGCQIHAAVIAPFFTRNQQHVQRVYLTILQDFYSLLYFARNYTTSDWSKDTTYDYAFSILREIPLTSQYLGYAPGRLFDLLSMSIRQYYPQLALSHLSPLLSSHTPSHSKKSKKNKKIRLGIVSGKIDLIEEKQQTHY
jgi:hypothetical protein